MAIYGAVPPPDQQPSSPVAASALPVQSPPTPVRKSAIDIDAWTISALQSLSVSPVARGVGSPLSIPIDQAPSAVKSDRRVVVGGDDEGIEPAETPRRPPSRRDSQRKRDLVLKGKEGSRQRRRWENGMA